MATILPPSGQIERSGPGWDVHYADKLRRRAVWGGVFLVVAFLGLLARLYGLQIVAGDFYQQKAQRNRHTRLSVPAPRGLITDRNGQTLATTRPRRNVTVLRALLPSARRQPQQRAQLIQTLAFLLDSTPDAIETRLRDADRLGSPIDPVTVAEDVDLALVTRIEENRARLGGAVSVTPELARWYPNGSVAAHALGFARGADQRDFERAKAEGKTLAFDEVLGKSGLEKQYDELLRGGRGERVWEVDAQGRPVREGVGRRPTPGATLQLTLDLKLQKAAEEALDAARNTGAVVALDPRNGEILALASNPGYDPNLFSLSGKEFTREYRKIMVSSAPTLNRAVASRFPPGSTFKPISAVAALEKGVANFSISCSGGFNFGRRFGCWSTHGDGIDFYDALAHSCNVYFYNAALKMGNPESSGPTFLAEIARKFGLGEKTGVDLPTESAGLIPDPEWRRRINKTRPDLAVWQPGNTLNMSIGQGDVLATPLQMARMTAAIGNGGFLPQPHLLREARDGSGKILEKGTVAETKVEVAANSLARVRQGMREVVTRGSGRGTNLKHVAVAGKTGSAEDFNNVLPHSWWVCFAPYDKPTIAIAVIIENSGHGSENALPVAKRILEAKFPAPKEEEAEESE